MNKSKNKNRLIDDQLAAFTDNMLEGDAEENGNMSTSDPELRALQQTVRHLKNVLPDNGPSDEVIQRMRQNVIHQWKQQENKSRSSFWMKLLSLWHAPRQKWQSQRNRRRWDLAIYGTTAVLILLVISPFIDRIGSPQPAASGQSPTFRLLVLLVGFVVLALFSFIRRR